MIGKKFPFQIVIIDEGVDLNTVKKEYPSFQGKISVMTMGRSYNYTKDIHGLPINHGTLCTLLLIEALQLYQEEKQTEIICIPITDENGKKTLENLLDALEYCTRVDVQMICMSLGVQDIFAGRKLLNIIKKMKKTSILAAAANDFTIAYPAVFRDVIGIKRSISFLEKIQVIRNPVDGIDLIAPYVETQLLKKLREQFHLDYSESNSIIVPKMAALFLHKIRYKSTDDYSKNFILNLLKEDSENIFESKGIAANINSN